MITINYHFAGFKELFRNMISLYHRETDSYKDANDQGLFERYQVLFGEYIDTDMAEEIENYLDILNAQICDEKYLNNISYDLGKPPDIFRNVEQYRNLLSYIIRIYPVKGTKRGYDLFFNILGFEVEVVEFRPPRPHLYYDTGERYDEELTYDPEECIWCSDYTLLVYPIDDIDTVDANTIALLKEAAKFNEPINAHLREFILMITLRDTLNITSMTDTISASFDDNVYYDTDFIYDTPNVTYDR